ncbi:MAG: gliding motility protein [Deltaproteobacteria bacterium]|nr:gliding motility protein [Deltaproteobacteria bacterium]
MTLKIVYYGPALSGKTTNLQAIHQLADGKSTGRLMTLDTKDDRTLFFDLLPVFFQTANGFKIKLKLFTVPGQVFHNATRRVVLQGADAVAFIADSQIVESKNNNESFKNLRENLEANGIGWNDIPVVIQFNKRDMPNARTDAEIDEMEKRGGTTIYRAVAIRGDGVMETLFGLLSKTWTNPKYDLEKKFGLKQAEFVDNIRKSLIAKEASVGAV